MIEKISIKNFKSHADTTIELGRVTALVGPNGCGKTSVLQAVHLASQFLHSKNESLFKGSFNPSYLMRKGQRRWEISLGVPDQLNQAVEAGVDFDINDNSPAAFILSGPQRTRLPEIVETLAQSKGSDFLARSAVDQMGTSIFFRGSAENLATPSYSESTTPIVSADGSGLASVIANLILTDRGKHEAMEHALSTIVPTVKTFRARPAKVVRKEKKVFSVNGTQFPYEEDRDLIGHELIFDMTSGDALTADLISEGTLLVLGILAVTYGTDSPQMILLDDIEQGLHPLAQIRLMQTLKAFAEQHDRQILLTSHSPYILDALEVKDVWVMDTDKEGISRCKRLSDHPDAKHALEVLTTGEFWDAEGEQWVTGETEVMEPVHA